MGIGFLKELGKAAPAHIPGKDLLLVWGRQPALAFQSVQQPDGVYVVGKALHGGADAQAVCLDLEVAAVIGGNFGMENMRTILRSTGSNDITLDLLDKGRIVQRLRVYHLAVYNPVFSQVFTNLLGVNVIKEIFRRWLKFGRRKAAVQEGNLLPNAGQRRLYGYA